jgi:hypothetical protein
MLFDLNTLEVALVQNYMLVEVLKIPCDWSKGHLLTLRW